MSTKELHTDTLIHHLSELFSTKSGHAPDGFEILTRKRSMHEGTFPAEILTCKLNNSQYISLRLKYTGGTAKYPGKFADRPGIGYEGKVYDEVLRYVSLPTVPFFGNCHFQDVNETWLVLEYFEDAVKLKQLEPIVFSKAAAWIANFHKLFKLMVPSFIKVYDMAYYTFWVNQVEPMARMLEGDYPWLPELCSYFRENIKVLLAAPQTLIHGEYYAKNILVRNDTVYPIDWETAAIAPGEIDLACLIDGKDEEAIVIAIDSYKSTCWPYNKDVPEKFEQDLVLAQIYLNFRWIAEWIDESQGLKVWMRSEKFSSKLRQLAIKAGCA